MENSEIEWTHHTHSLWRGCTKTSEACDFCYAETFWSVRKQLDIWGPGKPRQRAAKGTENKPRGWAATARAEGLAYRVFTFSQGDVNDADAAQRATLDAWRADLEGMISQTVAKPGGPGVGGGLVWLLLSKRPWLFSPQIMADPAVWRGFTAESQHWLDKRWAWLAGTGIGPEQTVFVSMEPLLSPIAKLPDGLVALGRRALVIVGGENCILKKDEPRRIPQGAPERIRDMCAEAGVNFLFKQWGSYGPAGDVRARKSEHGRMLQGRTHDEMPAAPYGLRWAPKIERQAA